MDRPAPRKPYTITEFSRLLGIGRNAGYDAAKRGDFPTIKIGKRILVPSVAADRLLTEGNAPKEAA